MSYVMDYKGSKEGNKKTLRAKECLEGLRKSSGKLYSSLAVFYVEQVALNRHVSPQPQLLCLCLKRKGMSRAKPWEPGPWGKIVTTNQVFAASNRKGEL
jgi:hypothetical protein